MDVVVVDPEDLVQAATTALGLADSGADLLSPEGIAASLRRAASFLAPLSKRALRNAVIEVLDGLPGWHDDMREGVATMLDALLAYHDLLELEGEDGVRQVFLAPPAFVPRGANSFFVMGVRPDGSPLLEAELQAAMTVEGHVRTITVDDVADIAESLRQQGFLELQPTEWVAAPRSRVAEDVVADFDLRLTGAMAGGDLGLVPLLDPESPVTYYRGRWRALKSGDTGRFILRRPQAFGSPLWCYTQVVSGEIVHVLDLPVLNPLGTGSDEAWYLQAAIDAASGKAQQYRLEAAATPDSRIVHFYSPLPGWAQRYVDLVGIRLLRSGGGALFSYQLATTDTASVLQFLEENLWMSEQGVRA